MSAALALSPVVVERLAGICRCAPSDITSGRVHVTHFEEHNNKFRADVTHRERGNVGYLGELRPPPGGYPPTKVSRVPPEPAPPSMSPQEALHRLPPKVIERIELSFRAKPGAVGAGELLVISFGAVGGRSGIFQALVYIRATNATLGLIGTFEAIPRRTTKAGDLTPDDLAVLVRVFGRLLKWDREAKASAAKAGGVS